MKVFVTRWLWSKGIVELNGEESHNDYFSVSAPGWGGICLPKGDWHKTREEAVAKAEDMQRRKLKKLKAEVAKVEAMKFA